MPLTSYTSLSHEADHHTSEEEVEVGSTSVAKSEFLATVSHELRTPLTSIKGSIGLLKGLMSKNTSGDMSDLLDIADRNSDVLLALINDLLDFENIVSGTMELNTEILEIAELTQKVIDANLEFAETHSVNFVTTTIDKPAWAHVDKHRFEQILRHLLSNAAKFSAPGKDIEISVMRKDVMVRISVRDYGIGISDEHKDVVFGRFTQIDSSDTRNASGTGLGLAISKALIEKMGGEIGFISEVDNGSTFFIDIPHAHSQSA